jgi:SpoVK/Ycf46/Vps4 family AAA+-type ATPase
MRDLELYIRARYPIIYLLSFEEERAIKEIRSICQGMGKSLWIWSMTEGLKMGGAISNRDHLEVLEAISKAEGGILCVLKDYHYFISEPKVTRRLRDLVSELKRSRKSLIILSPVQKVPQELEKDIVIVDHDLPGEEELSAMLEEIEGDIKRRGDIAFELLGRERELLVEVAKGLTLGEFENAISKAIAIYGALDGRAVEVVSKEKKQAVRKSGILEFYEAKEGISDIGGLSELKDWLRKRAKVFSPKARVWGLPEPKGILLVGVPGCGKSLTAKAISSLWKLPLLRLDFGTIFSGIVGSSEENMRRAIKTAEALAPVILWIDEIEKGTSGFGSSNWSDAGTAARVFGTFVTWLQERKEGHPVFVVATSNDVSQLPPELLRKGRFDEIFFVDLPSYEERKEIFRIHLAKRRRNPDHFDIDLLAMESEGFSGAEIEQAIISGLYEAFDEGKPLSTDHIIANIRATVPLSRMMEEEIMSLRKWAEKRARPASGRWWAKTGRV